MMLYGYNMTSFFCTLSAVMMLNSVWDPDKHMQMQQA